MEKDIKRAVTLASEMADIFNALVRGTQDLDLQRLFKQLEADVMDIRHKLSLAIKIISNNTE
ncbi:MAG: hypothetical protein B6D58_07430 [candidate division Zixibacteria bacterium 4484_95]|nr:MAG: hypothetical protein B6D58_07430 [candidate division Zixibacteria bacterium 4484_95]RKX18728.1 MAG: hypothetical protein DRP26_04670 [candidate division Zixibacteria bacterium]